METGAGSHAVSMVHECIAYVMRSNVTSMISRRVTRRHAHG